MCHTGRGTWLLWAQSLTGVDRGRGCTGLHRMQWGPSVTGRHWRILGPGGPGGDWWARETQEVGMALVQVRSDSGSASGGGHGGSEQGQNLGVSRVRTVRFC